MRYTQPSDISELRNKLVGAAAGLLQRRSLQTVTISDVVAAVRLNHSHFYAAFANLDELHAAAIDQLLRRELADIFDSKSNLQADAERDLLVERYLSAAGNGKVSAIVKFAGEIAMQRDANSLRATYTNAVLELAERLLGTAASNRSHEYHLLLVALIGARLLADALPDSKIAAEVVDAVMRYSNSIDLRDDIRKLPVPQIDLG